MTNERSAAEKIEQLLADGTICQRKWDHYGLPVYVVDGCEYAYAFEDGDADKAAEAYIRDSVWAFKASFLESYMPDGVDAEVIELLQSKCESANDAMYRLLKDRWDDFVEDAVASDGRGSFLSSYDGEEQDSDDVGLPAGGYAYRID